jgi:hypothetical protein
MRIISAESFAGAAAPPVANPHYAGTAVEWLSSPHGFQPSNR